MVDAVLGAVATQVSPWHGECPPMLIFAPNTVCEFHCSHKKVS